MILFCDPQIYRERLCRNAQEKPAGFLLGFLQSIKNELCILISGMIILPLDIWWTQIRYPDYLLGSPYANQLYQNLKLVYYNRGNAVGRWRQDKCYW